MKKTWTVIRRLKSMFVGSLKRRVFSLTAFGVAVSVLHFHLNGSSKDKVTKVIFDFMLPGAFAFTGFLLVMLMCLSEAVWKHRWPSVIARIREHIRDFVETTAVDAASFVFGIAIVAYWTGGTVDAIWLTFFAGWYAALAVYVRTVSSGSAGLSTLRAQMSLSYMIGITFSPFVAAHTLLH